MQTRIHTYARQQGGEIVHHTRHGEDMGGEIGVTGEVIPLVGWPTPAMRQAVSGVGDPMAAYVGTDEAGEIVRA